MTRTVLVGAEGTSSSRDALRWATRAAAQRGATLELVHATGYPTLAIDLLYDDAIAQGAKELLEQESTVVTEVDPQVPVRVTIDPRRPADALTDRSHDAELLVVGSHRLTAVERVFSGSRSYQIAAGASCPVVVVPRLPGPEARGVVVGADGSPDSLEAIALAAAEADRGGDELTVVHAWQEPTIYASADVFPTGVTEQVREAERVILGESVAGLSETYPDLVVHQRLVHDQPAAALLDAAQGARLVVVGSRGRHGITRALLGSVSHAVVLHAQLPVMVARVRRHRKVAHH